MVLQLLDNICLSGYKKVKKNIKKQKILLTIKYINVIFNYVTEVLGDQLSWLEHLPYKQGVIGSSPISPTIYFAGIAQLVEQLTCNQQVVGSSPISGTIFYGGIAKWSNAADCKSVPSGSMVQIHLPPPYFIWLLPRSQAVRHHTLTVAFRQFESSRGSHF